MVDNDFSQYLINAALFCAMCGLGIHFIMGVGARALGLFSND